MAHEPHKTRSSETHFPGKKAFRRKGAPGVCQRHNLQIEGSGVPQTAGHWSAPMMEACHFGASIPLSAWRGTARALRLTSSMFVTMFVSSHIEHRAIDVSCRRQNCKSKASCLQHICNQHRLLHCLCADLLGTLASCGRFMPTGPTPQSAALEKVDFWLSRCGFVQGQGSGGVRGIRWLPQTLGLLPDKAAVSHSALQ